jgi:hypothetical protein
MEKQVKIEGNLNALGRSTAPRSKNVMETAKNQSALTTKASS